MICRAITIHLLSVQTPDLALRPCGILLTAAQPCNRNQSAGHPSLPTGSCHRHCDCLCRHWCGTKYLCRPSGPYRCRCRMAAHCDGRRKSAKLRSDRQTKRKFTDGIQLVWLLYLTSEEDSTFYRLLNAGGNGGLAGNSHRSQKRQSAAAFTGNETGISSAGFGNTPRATSGINGSGIGGGPAGGGGGYPMGGYANAGVDTTPVKSGPMVDFNNNSPGPNDMPVSSTTQRAK